MPSRRDILKATGGLVLATGGSWLTSHAHGAEPGREPAEQIERSRQVEARGAPLADPGEPAPLASPP